MAALWGRTPAQVLGQSLLEALPELHGQGFDTLLTQVLTTEQAVTGTETPAQLLRDGQLHTSYYNFVYQPLYDAQGQLLGVVDVAVEVTEQVVARQQVEQLNQTLEAKVAERTAQLSRQQRLLDQILRQLPAAVATFAEPIHLFTFFNERYQQLATGRAQRGVPAAQALPEVAAQGFVTLLDEVYITGQPYEGQAQRVELPHPVFGYPVPYYFDSRYQPLLDEQGLVEGVLVFAVEVSEQVYARQQVQQLNADLAVSNEKLRASNERLHDTNRQLTRTNVNLDAFVYTASHDLKTPIANIEGIALALRDTLPPVVQQDELVAHLLSLLSGAVARFHGTIGHLMDVAQLQRRPTDPPESLALAVVVAGVRQELGAAIAQAPTHLLVAIPTSLRVSCVPADLHRIVSHLLRNAIHYRDPTRPSVVLVRAQQRGPGVVLLTVQDNGLGLTKTQQGRLFGLFQRLHTHVEGAGVGLYLTKRLVENAGGTIAVTSAPGVGTIFRVTLLQPVASS